MTTADAKALTPAFLAMTPLQKWETLVLSGLIGTDEPWIDDMRQALRDQEAALEAPHSMTEAVRDAVIAAYRQGAQAVHEHWAEADTEARAYLQRQSYPDFTEAAHDYADEALAMQSARPIDQEEASDDQ